MATWHGKTSRNLGRTGIAAVVIVLLACGSAAAKELKLTRTAKSGVETRLAYSAHWDTKTCNRCPTR